MMTAEKVLREAEEWRPPHTDWQWGDMPFIGQLRNCSIDDIIQWLAEVAEDERSETLAATAIVLREKVEEIDAYYEELHVYPLKGGTLRDAWQAARSSTRA